jgi:hypothetical protein
MLGGCHRGMTLSAHLELSAIDLEKAVAALRHMWREAKGDGQVPLREAFTPELLRPWLPNIVLVEAIGAPPRFRIRLVGTAAVAFAGRDFTGKFLDDVIETGQYDITIAPYLNAAAIAAPVEDDVLRHQFVAPDGTYLPVRRLVMPCSSNGIDIDRFVVGLFRYHPESRS